MSIATRLRVRLSLPGVAVLAGAYVIVGRAAGQQPPTFRSGVEIARVEVSVLDRDRRPVRGLSTDDFEIKVEGQVQPIVNVSEVEVSAPDMSGAAWLRDVSSDVATNDLSSTRLFVILMDDLNTDPEPWIVRNSRQAARRFVETLGPNDLASVVFTYNNSHAQELTRDHTKLFQAIDAFTYGPGPPRLPGMTEMARAAVVSAVQTLAEAQQFRRALLLVGPGGVWLEEVRRRLLPTFAIARVPIYSVSTVGLEGPINSRGGLIPSSFSRGADALKNIADYSGGFAITGTNDPLPAIDGIIRENNAYYVIGYRATYPTGDGRSRRLVVRVKKPRVEVFPPVRTIGRSVSKPPKNIAPDLTGALQEIVPDADVPLKVALAPFGLSRSAAGDKAAVAIVLNVETQPAAARTEVLEVETRAFDNQGLHQIAQTNHTASVRLEANATSYEVRSHLELKPGRYNLRFATRSVTGTTASVYSDVVVPDFAGDALTLSGVILGEASAAPADPNDLEILALPFAPTTRREFDRANRVRTFLRVYQGGDRAVQDAAMSLRVVDERDAVVFAGNEPLAGRRFGSARSADCLFELPSLAPGRYLLRFSATLGSSTASRDVRLQIK